MWKLRCRFLLYKVYVYIFASVEKIFGGKKNVIDEIVYSALECFIQFIL